MSRKSNLDALFAAKPVHKPVHLPAPLPAPSPEPDGFAAANQTPDGTEFAAANPPAAPRRRSGAIGAMSQTLRGLAAQADAAASLEAGSAVVEIEPGLIDASFIADRVADPTDPSLASLVESVRESGQQVPVLVRPHPVSAGRYQIAYGRRRVRAAQILARPVRAVIRPLTDAELVIAQGKENLERRDLSYIERAFFARRLEEHGFPRDTITAAMGVGKGDLSTLISVARTVPEDILAAIGPAPAAGRPRWMLLAEGIRTADRAALSALLADPAFRAKSTDQRFAAILAAVAALPARGGRPQVWTDPQGRRLARVERGADRVAVSFDERLEPGLADYILDQLPEILAAYRRSRS
ncbi:plasmid partitioning protein RepB [Methylobacterium sp. WSM2598]|uniref:plasmid partitioning protein RepB n=1 Tax=Methylobacterium sp. WSM2598 TaxID=398261 RepID=UPI000366FAF6|nr:plasmid partitioning protein RepB [Methylobacterium sp. WSM2598]